ncbi:hypothetical protein BCR37DRAFT_386605 [Protomyces lactucae-debilis]|uniref:DUF1764-domain-containing protein n=1 Tax=Protomyces lactucae-debilis TaxID=2754530 RepID=A0A1Y2FLK5_PROLT|nr:uncharacterized protein BCR37DRAFT_386605 [Protomyces lactucae-debilis]ORY84457.1 hypothetical protein BCR37DRAFT_386605 [Protomyces lactucae-debilis]
MGKSQEPKKSNDIDDIFAKKASKPTETAAQDDTKSSTSKLKSAKQGKNHTAADVRDASVKKPSKKPTGSSIPKALPSDDSLFTDLKGSKKRKTTEEGFKIYDDEELRIDPNAGSTDDCPFDCQCCF